MLLKHRSLALYLLEAVLYVSVAAFGLYEFKRNTVALPIYFVDAENDLKAGRESAARKKFDDALQHRPADPTAYLSILQTCREQNKPALEIEYSHRALAACKLLRPEVQFAFYQVLSESYSQIEQPPHQQLAIAASRQALALAPDNHVAENEYGYLLADNAAGRGPDVDTALRVLKKALIGINKGPTSTDEVQLGPSFKAMAEDSYGWALYKNEQFADAVTALTQALADYPDSASGEMRKTSYYHLGMAEAELGQREPAQTAFKSALAIDANYKDAQAARAALATTQKAGPTDVPAPSGKAPLQNAASGATATPPSSLKQ